MDYQTAGGPLVLGIQSKARGVGVETAGSENPLWQTSSQAAREERSKGSTNLRSRDPHTGRFIAERSPYGSRGPRYICTMLVHTFFSDYHIGGRPIT